MTGDDIEFFAEIDLIGALSACPGGDCGQTHSTDAVTCYALKVEVFDADAASLAGWTPPPANGYPRSHGEAP